MLFWGEEEKVNVHNETNCTVFEIYENLPNFENSVVAVIEFDAIAVASLDVIGERADKSLEMKNNDFSRVDVPNSFFVGSLPTTQMPTYSPTTPQPQTPTFWPTRYPTLFPTLSPTENPTPATCRDGIMNNFEQGVDCGGFCQACTDEPTQMPTMSTSTPTVQPTRKPTVFPTQFRCGAVTSRRICDKIIPKGSCFWNGLFCQDENRPTLPPSDESSPPISLPPVRPSQRPTENPTQAPKQSPTQNPTRKPIIEYTTRTPSTRRPSVPAPTQMTIQVRSASNDPSGETSPPAVSAFLLLSGCIFSLSCAAILYVVYVKKNVAATAARAPGNYLLAFRLVQNLCKNQVAILIQNRRTSALLFGDTMIVMIQAVQSTL